MKEKGLTKQDSLCLKGIAIMMMLFHHLYLSESRFLDYSVSFFPLTQDFVVSLAFFFKICVSIFAFITGYGLYKSISGIKLEKRACEEWYVKRLLKTMSGYYFIVIISWVVTQSIDKLPQKTYFDKGIASGILYMISELFGLQKFFKTPMLIETWWYMSAAVLFILLVPVFFAISRKAGFLPIIAGVIAIPRMLNVGYPGGVNPYTFILPMLFGMVFAEYNIFEIISEKLSKKKIISYLLAFLFFGGGCVFFFIISLQIPQTKAWELEYGIAPLFYICFFRIFIIRIPVLSNILAFLGKLSMTMYLTHTFIRYNYLSDFVYSPSNFLEIFALMLVLSVALALIIDMLKKIIRYDLLFDKIIKNC